MKLLAPLLMIAVPMAGLSGSCAHDAPPGPSPSASPSTATATVAVLDVARTSSVGSTSVTPKPAAGSGAAASEAPSGAPEVVPVSAGGPDPSPRPDQPGVAPERGTAVIPADATAAARDLKALTPVLKAGITAQPYGKTFAELVKKTPAPPDKKGLGGADTHPDLARDPIEVQAQVQYLEETKIEGKFGHASVRLVRQYRYGKVAATQIVIEAIGRTPADRAAFEADLTLLAQAWKSPVAALGLDDARYRAARNDLLPLGKDRPLRIIVEPIEEGSPQ